MTSTEPSLAEPGASAGKYRLLAKLGEGGMAVVNLAVASGPSGFTKLVVVKELREALRAEAELVDMFLDEGRLAARLNHPNVVQTYEVGEHEGTPVIVMEYLDGQSLSTILHKAFKGESVPLAIQLRALADTLNGLHHAHDLADYDGTPLSLVHRDVSPHNIFVTFDGQTKLLDFGIAKAANARSKTATGIVKGKVRYMAPEQMGGDGTIDRRADVYAAGVILWEIASRRRLWDKEPDVQVMVASLNGAIQPPTPDDPRIAEPLVRITMRALESDRAKRYQTAAEFAADVEDLIATMGERASPRQMAKFMEATFGEERKRARAILEQRVRDAALPGFEGLPTGGPATSTSTRSKVNATVSVTGANGPPEGDGTPLGSTTSRRVREPLSNATKQRLLPFFALLLIGGTATATIALRGAGGRDATAHTQAGELSSPASTAIPPAPASALASTVTRPGPVPRSVSLSASPRDAKLSLDGRPLATNPATVTLPEDGEAHTLHAEAPGYAARSSTFTAEAGADISLALVRKTREPQGVPAGGGTAHRPPPSPAAAAPARDCSTPYFIDDRGIKKFKPECF